MLLYNDPGEYFGINRDLNEMPVNATSPLSSNMLNLSLEDIGIDDRGNWFCYSAEDEACWNSDAQFYYDSFNYSNQYGYPGATFAAVDISYEYIALFLSDPLFVALQKQQAQSGGTAAGLQDSTVPLQIRYSVDGTVQHDQEPSCRNVFTPPQGVKAFEYSFKTRLRLWNTSATQLRVWLCVNSSAVKYVSELNISSELAARGIKPLAPGPYLSLTVPLTNRVSVSVLAQLQNELCLTIWSVVDERCWSRIWLLSESTSSLVFRIISFSNSRVNKAGYVSAQLIQSAAFKSKFPQVQSGEEIVFFQIIAPWPKSKLNRSSLLGCVSHYDCDDGLFCSSKALMTFARGFVGAGGPGPTGFACDLCRYCLNDFTDPVDVQCPRDKCGLQVGSYPTCVDAKKFFGRNFSCQNKYVLNMSLIPPVPRTSPPLNIVPLFSPNSTVRKARFLTPYNQLFGAITITQTRLAGTCPLMNDSIGRYSATKDPNLGPICRGSVTDSGFFGKDPVFSRTSTLYEGDISSEQFYSESEVSSSGKPYAFFPHSYDGQNHSIKPREYILQSEADKFKLYFTEQLSAVEANRLVTYMTDGGFLDFQTDELSVQFVTLNSNLNMFAIFSFTFSWQVISGFF